MIGFLIGAAIGAVIGFMFAAFMIVADEEGSQNESRR